MNWQETERCILSKLPDSVSGCIRGTVPLYDGIIEEIRLRANRPLALTANGKNIPLTYVCTWEDLQSSARMLCDNALYSHLETIREGYICAAGGIRIGICGRAVVENGKISLLRDISSLCIRIPKRVPKAGDELLAQLARGRYTQNILVFSPPGCGKTTVLRELAAGLSSGGARKRVAVVDTRFELSAGLEEAEMLDVLYGYPRDVGLEIAARTMAPEYIICDEIVSAGDRQALLHCVYSGIHFCTSVHADRLSALRVHPALDGIYHLFDWFYGIDRSHKGTLTSAEGETVYV